MMKSRYRAFTLIELLVVVAIIALLVSILLPALEEARETAKATVCMSNLKQTGYSIMFYADHHEGWMRAKYYAPPIGTFWSETLVDMDYLESPGVLVCPSWPPYEFDPTAYTSPQDAYILTYGIRSGWTPTNPGGWPGFLVNVNLIKDIPKPADFVVLGDSTWEPVTTQYQPYFFGCDIALPGGRRLHLRHFGKANTWFADGSVRSLTESDLDPTGNKYYILGYWTEDD